MIAGKTETQTSQNSMTDPDDTKTEGEDASEKKEE